MNFDRYNTEMNSYLDCLKLKTDALTPKDPTKLSPEEKKKVDEQQKMLIQKNNAAVDELQANVGHFNDQLKIFLGEEPKKSAGTARRSLSAARLTPCRRDTLITPRQAEAAISSRLTCLPIESLPLTQCVGGILRENIYAERDQPPFDRVTMDGIAGDSETWRQGLTPAADPGDSGGGLRRR